MFNMFQQPDDFQLQYQPQGPSLEMGTAMMENPMEGAPAHPMYEMSPMGKRQTYSQVVQDFYGDEAPSHMDQAMSGLIGPGLGALGAFATGGRRGVGAYGESLGEQQKQESEAAAMQKRQRENDPRLLKSYFKAAQQAGPNAGNLGDMTREWMGKQYDMDELKDVNSPQDLFMREGAGINAGVSSQDLAQFLAKNKGMETAAEWEASFPYKREIAELEGGIKRANMTIPTVSTSTNTTVEPPEEEGGIRGFLRKAAPELMNQYGPNPPQPKAKTTTQQTTTQKIVPEGEQPPLRGMNQRSPEEAPLGAPPPGAVSTGLGKDGVMYYLDAQGNVLTRVR